MGKVPDGPEVRTLDLLRFVGALDRHGDERCADPRSADQDLEFVRITLGTDMKALSQVERVTAKTTLRVAESDAGFDAKPKRGDGVRATAPRRAARSAEIPNANDERVGLRR